jgi:hypothetical protein
MRVIGLLLLLGLAETSTAQTVYSLDPPSPVAAGQEVALRIDSALGCFHSNLIEVTRNGEHVNVVAEIEDTIPPEGCPPAWLTPRFVPLGTFAAGQHEVGVTMCTNAPPPLPECALQTILRLTVFGRSGSVFAVPALSSATMIGLMIAFAMLGVIPTNRR